MHSFSDNGDVVTTLNELMPDDSEPLIVKLPRTPGRKDSEYTHLFCGDIDIESYETEAATAAKPRTTTSGGQLNELIERVSALETEVLELKRRLNENN